MLNCLIREEIKFGKLTIPSFTNGIIINGNKRITPSAPGVNVLVSISQWECNDIEKQLKKIDSEHHFGRYAAKYLDGITIRISTKDLFIIYEHDLHDTQLYKWQLKDLIVPITQNEEKPEYMKDYEYLGHVVNCFDDWFSDWVHKNCKFRRVTKADKEESAFFEDVDRILTDEGLEMFFKKQQELMVNIGEATGYTLEFKGGLNWND
jgi:hypothetical protein